MTSSERVSLLNSEWPSVSNGGHLRRGRLVLTVLNNWGFQERDWNVKGNFNLMGLIGVWVRYCRDA